MSKCIQLSNGAGNLFPTNADLLWTNPSPTSDFNAQTVSVNGAGYSKYLIEYLLHITVPNPPMIANPLIINVGDRGISMCPSGTTGATLGNLYLYGRVVNSSSATGIEFADNYVSQSGGGWTKNNSGLVPYRIYGMA